MIAKLTEYVNIINDDLLNLKELPIQTSPSNLKGVIYRDKGLSIVKFLNFNYTETLSAKYGVDRDEIIYIHGRAQEVEQNPVIFGYGDESES